MQGDRQTDRQREGRQREGRDRQKGREKVKHGGRMSGKDGGGRGRESRIRRAGNLPGAFLELRVSLLLHELNKL